MIVEPAWLTEQEAIALNQEAVADSDEAHALPSMERLEGAIARPQQLFAYEGVGDPLVLDARLCIAIAAAHPFEQGNKRTAWAALTLFLANNGYLLYPPNDPTFGRAGCRDQARHSRRCLDPHLEVMDPE